MRWTWLAFSRVSCLRARARSRSACSGIAGTKLGRMRPWASRSASHVASFTSVLRPGTAFTWWALASTSSKSPAKAGQTFREPLQLRCRGGEGLDQPAHTAGLGQAHASHDGVPMNVEPGATHVEDVHNRLPFGRRRRGAPDDRSLGCVLRPKGLATVRGAQRAPGPTHTRARGTKNEPTSGPAPRSTIDRFHPARVGLRSVGNLYQRAGSEALGSCRAGGSLTRCGEPREVRHGCADCFTRRL